MRASRLFHTVVVVGAEFGTACGGNTEVGTGAAAHGAVPPVVTGAEGGIIPRADAFWPNACAHESQYRCANYAPLEGCVCDRSAPEGPAACGGDPKFQCDHIVSNPDASSPSQPNVDCRCLPDAPGSPEDCPGGPGQFECDTYSPNFRTCRCNTTRPGNPVDCPLTDAFQCQEYSPVYYACTCSADVHGEAACTSAGSCNYTCASVDPRFGCQCQCVVPIR